VVSPPAASGVDRPKIAGRYVPLQPLGQGGAGAVFAAYDSELHRHVALKFLRRQLRGGEGDEWRARLLREAKAMARLSHPNVVTLYDVGVSSEDGVFLAMELVEGGTLADWLQKEARSASEIVSLLCDAGEGLAAAHRAGMIHRDFKLDNVLLGKDGRPRVTDFGLARNAEAPARREEAPAEGDEPPARRDEVHAKEEVYPPEGGALAKLTLTGSIMGTPGYMAPEQYRSDVEIDARADIFAFCATLYRALYGERPFAGDTFEQIAHSTLHGEVRRPSKGRKVPSWVRRVVLSGLATDREARPASMPELLAALRADPAKKRWRWLAAGIAAAAACLVLLDLHAISTNRMIAGSTARGDVRAEGPAETSSAGSSGAARGGDREDTVAIVESRATREGDPIAPGEVAAVGSSTKTTATPASAPKPARPALAAAVKGVGGRAKGGGVLANRTAQPRAASSATPTCTIEMSHDAEGAPHFKKVCE
jgi:Protein kinase domain